MGLAEVHQLDDRVLRASPPLAALAATLENRDD
jgi:hypothetical protein